MAPDHATIKAELEAILVASRNGRNSFEGHSTKRIYALFAKTRRLDKYACDSFVLGVVERVLGSRHFNLSAPVGISIGPGERAQVPHRDDGKFPIDRPHPELIVNTMWALDDFTAQNGATVVWPFSHSPAETDRRQAYEDGIAAAAVGGHRAVRAVMPRGSVLFYRGSLLHGGASSLHSQQTNEYAQMCMCMCPRVFVCTMPSCRFSARFSIHSRTHGMPL